MVTGLLSRGAPARGAPARGIPARAGRTRHAVGGFAPLLVLWLSLLALVGVGFVEVHRIHPELLVGRLAALGEIARVRLADDLKDDALSRAAGAFGRQAAVLLREDSSVAAVMVADAEGRPVLRAGSSSTRLLSPEAEVPQSVAGFRLRRDSAQLQVWLPLPGPAGPGPSLVLALDRAAAAAALTERFRLPLLLAFTLPVALAALAAGLGLGARGPGAGGNRTRPLWLRVTEGGAFLAMAVLLIGLLVSLYAENAAARAAALAAALGEQVGQSLDRPAGPGPNRLAPLVASYRGLAPDIAAVAVLKAGQAVAHTDPAMVGQLWERPGWSREQGVDLDGVLADRLVLAYSPLTLVHDPGLLRNVKDLAALFFAMALLANLLRQVGGLWRRQTPERSPPTARLRSPEAVLDLVRPVFFLSVFVENLSYAFLPSLLKDVAAASGLPPIFASGLFMTYFLSFALILVPAGHWGERNGPKPLVVAGLALSACGLLLPVMSLHFLAVMSGRLLAGIGQGMVLIGVQSCILGIASAGRRTQGTAIIVYGFNGGMIAGIAVGSLLVSRIGIIAVFSLAAAIAVGTALFVAAIMPDLRQRRTASLSFRQSLRALGRNTLGSLASLDFVKTTLLIGIPAKGVLTGVVLFALPLLLTQQGVAAEDVGQVIMFYAMGVLAASPIVSRLADRTGRTGQILLIGSLLSGLGLLMIGATGRPPLAGDPRYAVLVTSLLVAAVLVIGIAHGFINAPVVSHVAGLPVAREIGPAHVTATYRFLERLGHVAGPVFVAQALALGQQSAAAMTWIGTAVIVYALLFAVRTGDRRIGASLRRRRVIRPDDPHA